MQAPCNSAPPDAAFSTTSDNKHLATTYTIAPAIINPYLASRDEAHAPYRPHNYPIEKIPITAV